MYRGRFKLPPNAPESYLLEHEVEPLKDAVVQKQTNGSGLP